MLALVHLTRDRLTDVWPRVERGQHVSISIRRRTIRLGLDWRIALLLANIRDLTFDDETVEFSAARDPAVVAVGLLRGSGQPSHTHGRVRLEELEPLSAPLPIRRIVADLDEPLASEVANFARRTGEISAASGELVVQALLRLRPELTDTIERLRGLTVSQRLTDDGSAVLAMEADAARLAVQIAGFALPTRAWDPTETGGYLDRLAYRPPEASHIAYDAARFPDWQPLAGSRTDWLEFSDGDHRLRIGNVNMTRLELVLGVDLIYWHRDRDCFVMVQYKKMSASRRQGVGVRPDAQFDEELDRMRRIDALPHEGGGPDEWRLYPHGCFFKLVRDIESFDPTSDRLLSGIYLPVSYLDEIRAAGTARGEGGGEWLGYDTIDRYITSTLFVDLVRQGWIGTRGVTSRVVRQLVEAAIADDHSVIVAEERGVQDGAARRRRQSAR